VRISSLIQVLSAAHLTYAIDGVPEAFSQRGGIMLVSPPENLKTQAVSCLRHYPNALVLGDITTLQAVKLRTEIASGRYQSLVLTEVEKLYKRDMSTSANIEGILQAMVEEGFGHAAFEDKSVFVRQAKCLVIGALVEDSYSRHYPTWKKDGFARRFLWSHYILKDRNALIQSIGNWKPLVLSEEDLPLIPGDSIPWTVTKPEARECLRMISTQEGTSTPFVLVQKILCVLKWRYRNMGSAGVDRAMTVLKDFGQSLNKDKGGAILELDTLKTK